MDKICTQYTTSFYYFCTANIRVGDQWVRNHFIHENKNIDGSFFQFILSQLIINEEFSDRTEDEWKANQISEERFKRLRKLRQVWVNSRHFKFISIELSKNQLEFVLYFILRSNVCSTFEWVYVLTELDSKTTVCS